MTALPCLANVPVLETERLVLRAPRAEDTDAAIGFLTSPRARFVDGPMDFGQAWRAWAADIAHWVIRGYGSWIVTGKGSDTALGLVGPWHPGDWPEREIGWMVMAGAEGKGIAHEAALAARAHAYEVLGWDTAVSYIDHANTRSIRLAERLGATPDPAAAMPPGAPCLVYRHPGPGERT